MILSKYVVSSILKIAIVTIVVFTLLLAAVELFTKMDSIMENSISFLDILRYISLSVPQYMLMVSSIAFLFAVTYFFSSLSANNEMIALLNAGLGEWRIKRPVIFLAIILALLGSLYQEKVVIKVNALHDIVETELFGTSSTTDTRNIVLTDQDGFMIYTKRYSEKASQLVNPVLVKYDDGAIVFRLSSDSAYFDEEKGCWVFVNAGIHSVTDSKTVEYEHVDEWFDPSFDIEPRLFRSQNMSIETMDRLTASDYLSDLYDNDRTTWHANATDYYRRIFTPFAIFVLIFISLSMNYNFKKNILLFALIESLSIAVVYYVSDMVASIMGHQGIIEPITVVILPFAFTIFISFVFSFITGRI